MHPNRLQVFLLLGMRGEVWSTIPVEVNSEPVSPGVIHRGFPVPGMHGCTLGLDDLS